MEMQIEKSRIREIIDLHGEIADYLKISLNKAIRIGELLTEQKKSLKHGEFTPWIKANLPFTARTAQNYMQFYHNRELFKTESVSDLSSAYAILTEIKKDAARLLKEKRQLSHPDISETIEYGKIAIDVEYEIRKGLQHRLESVLTKVDKKINLLSKLRDEIELLIAESTTCDLNEAVIRIEKMNKKVNQAKNLLDINLLGTATGLQKVLKDPNRLFSCKRVLSNAPGIPSPPSGARLPMWKCGIHSDCWSTWGFEAGPPETHIAGNIKCEPSEPGKCNICKKASLALFVLVENGDLVCPDCYWGICREASKKVEAEIARLQIQTDNIATTVL